MYQNNQDPSLLSGSDILRYIWTCRASAIYDIPINWRYIHKRCPALVTSGVFPPPIWSEIFNVEYMAKLLLASYLTWNLLHFLLTTSSWLGEGISHWRFCNHFFSPLRWFDPTQALLQYTIWEIPQSFFSMGKHSWFVLCLYFHPVTIWFSAGWVGAAEPAHTIHKTAVDCQWGRQISP